MSKNDPLGEASEMDLSRSIIPQDFEVYSGTMTGIADQGVSTMYNAVIVIDALAPHDNATFTPIGQVNLALTACQAGDLILSLVGVAWQNNKMDSRFGSEFIQGFVTALAYANHNGDGAGSHAFNWMGDEALKLMRRIQQETAKKGPQAAADGPAAPAATDHTGDAPEAQQ